MIEDVTTQADDAAVKAKLEQVGGGHKTWKIAVLPGDGIGAEVMAEGLKVLVAVAALFRA